MTINSAAAIVAEASGLGVTAGASASPRCAAATESQPPTSSTRPTKWAGSNFNKGPHAVALADKGWQQALRDDQSLALGLNTHAGQLTNGPVSTSVGIDSVDPAAALA